MKITTLSPKIWEVAECTARCILEALAIAKVDIAAPISVRREQSQLV